LKQKLEFGWENFMSSMSETALYPILPARSIKRVAILFAGGPAPAANAVISTAAASFRKNGIDVIGIMHGYAHLVEYRDDNPMVEGRDYVVLDQSNLKRTRNTRGILIGTSRTNPGKDVSKPAHLADPERTAQLRTVHRALCSLGVDALVSIGGDDTLKTANKFQRFQEHLPDGEPRIAVVHVPKTIDNDYRGIDFTFGYFTAVETLAGLPMVRPSRARPAWSFLSKT
jgi:6-phosphofructokinase